EHAELRHVGEADRVVDAREYRLAEVEADLFGVDVERGHELNVADVIAPEVDVHQPGHALARVGVAVELDALHEAAGAVTDAGDRDADFVFGGAHDAVAPSGRLASSSARSCAISSSIHSRSCWVDWARCSRSDRV